MVGIEHLVESCQKFHSFVVEAIEFRMLRCGEQVHRREFFLQLELNLDDLQSKIRLLKKRTGD